MIETVLISHSQDTRLFVDQLAQDLGSTDLTLLILPDDGLLPDTHPSPLAVILVLSQLYVDQIWPLWESWLGQGATGTKPLLIPIMRQPCSLPPPLARLHPVDFTPGADPEQALAELLARLAPSFPATPLFQSGWRTHRDSSTLLWSLARHTDFVLDLVVTPDSRYALSAAKDGAILQWDLHTGEALQALIGHRGPVNSLILVAEGRQLLSLGRDGTARLWERVTGEAIALWSGMDATTHTAARLDTGLLVLAGNGSVLTRLNPQDGSVFHLTGHTDWVRALCALPGGRLASAGDDRTLRIWDGGTGQALAVWPISHGYINALAPIPGRPTVLTGVDDRTVRVWDLVQGQVVADLGRHDSSVRAVAVSPDGQIGVSGDAEGGVKVWDLAAGVELATYLGHAGGVTQVVVEPTGRLALSASTDHTVKVWRLPGSFPSQTANPELDRVSPHSDPITGLAVSPDGAFLMAGSDEGVLSVWESGSGRLVESHTEAVAITALVALPHATLLFARADGQLRRWHWQGMQDPQSFGQQKGAMLALALSPDGRTLASATENWSIRLWDLESGRARHTLAGHRASILALAFLPDGRLVSGDEGGRLLVWESETGKLVANWSAHQAAVNGLAGLARGVVTASDDGTLTLWDVARHRPLRVYCEAPDWVTGVVRGPDRIVQEGREPQQTLLSVVEDGSVFWWDGESGQQLAAFHQEPPATALAVHGSILYLGDAAGNLFRYTLD